MTLRLVELVLVDLGRMEDEGLRKADAAVLGRRNVVVVVLRVVVVKDAILAIV